MTLIVLAAGMGSRYGGLKQMDPVTEHGEFIIDFSIYDAIRAGYDRVIFIIKRENYDAFRETVGKRVESHIRVDYVFQEMTLPEGVAVPENRTKPFGTAHALLACKDVVDGDFAVINADDYYGVRPYRMAYDYMCEAKDENGVSRYCMVGYRLGNTLTENGTVSRGICAVDENGYLSSITERTKIRPDGEDGAAYLDGETWVNVSRDSIVSMNFFAFRDSFLTYVEEGLYRFATSPETNLEKDEYFLPSAAGDTVRAGAATLRVLETDDKWFGVTYPQDKAEVVASLRRLIDAGVYPDGLWKKN